jgi:hypothetical protein
MKGTDYSPVGPNNLCMEELSALGKETAKTL